MERVYRVGWICMKSRDSEIERFFEQRLRLDIFLAQQATVTCPKLARPHRVTRFTGHERRHREILRAVRRFRARHSQVLAVFVLHY